MSAGATAAGGLSLTVHQWLQRLAPDYLRRFGAAMPARQRAVLDTIVSCRTPARGGELFACPNGHGFDYRYHSCNDRHCPLCGQTDAEDWLARQRQRLLLPVPYFLVTFTVPEALRDLLRSHMQLGLDLLFACSAQALQDLAANPRRLGAQLAMLGVLHTWSRTLIFHPHIHLLVPGGGLSPDQRRWVPGRPQFLLHHRALGQRVRTLFQQGLQRQAPDLLAQVPAVVWQTPWNVGAQAAGSGENVLRYLARYIFKTATDNRPLQQLPDGRLRWPYRDSATGRDTAIALEPREWIRRPRSPPPLRPRGVSPCVRTVTNPCSESGAGTPQPSYCACSGAGVPRAGSTPIRHEFIPDTDTGGRPRSMRVASPTGGPCPRRPRQLSNRRAGQRRPAFPRATGPVPRLAGAP